MSFVEKEDEQSQMRVVRPKRAAAASKISYFGFGGVQKEDMMKDVTMNSSNLSNRFSHQHSLHNLVDGHYELVNYSNYRSIAA